MAERAQTLPPLTSQDKALLWPHDDDEVLTQMRQRFTQAVDAEREERQSHEAALRFRQGEQWPQELTRRRSQPGQERLCLVVDRTGPFIQQIVNAYRRAPLGMRVRPKSGGATKQVADILEGKLRDIEQQSEADIAYTVALDQAVGQGLGYFRLVTDYDDDHAFQQCAQIRPLYNRFAVYVDPASVHPGGLDLEWAFIVERVSTSAFCQQWKVRETNVAAWCGPGDSVWHSQHEVQVVEYFFRTWEVDTLVQLPNGVVLPTTGLGELDPTWPTRSTRLPTVWWVKATGYTILDKTRWLGRYIPLIRVEGQRLDLDGQSRRTGIIQAAQDSQRSYNYYASAEAEAIALAPKAPYLVYAEQIAGYEDDWDQANDVSQPYLRHKVAHGAQGETLPPPRREVAEPAIQAISQARLLAAEDLKATVGMFNAALGAPGNETSGVAIDARKVEGEQTTHGYAANLAWSIRACGIQLLDLLPKLYSGPTQLRQVGTDGSVTMTPVNQPYTDESGQRQEHLLGQGHYECTISAGPSYETNRLEASEKLGTILAAVPQTAPYLLDVWAGTLDFPGSEGLAQRLKTLVPPEALAASEQTDPRTQLVTLQNQLKQATQALQMLQQQAQEAQQQSQVATQSVALLEQQVAQMQSRLADKQTENQLQAQKQQMEYEIDRQKLALEAQKLGLEAQQALYEQANGRVLPED